MVDEHPEAVRGFLAAIEQAVIDINQNPAQWESLLVDRQLVPAPLIGTYQVPQFPIAGVPSEAQFADAVDWVQEKNLLATDFLYSDMINTSFLP